MLLNSTLVIALLAASFGYATSPDSAASPIVERVGDTVFPQIEVNSFNGLTPKQQALASGLYAEYLEKANGYLARARSCAEPERRSGVRQVFA
jgi:hypothetical protein